MVCGRISLVALVPFAFGSVTSAQGQPEAVPVQEVGTARITMRTGELVRGEGGEKSAGLANAFSNVDWSGYFGVGLVTNSVTGNLIEWMDWGELTTPTGSDIVGEFTFGYGTSISDTLVGGPGASVVLRFYDGITGFCADSGTVPTATFAFSGLPASSLGSSVSWMITVDLTGGFEFASAGVGNPFGYGFTTADDIADDGTRDTGPLLCYAGAAFNCHMPDSNGQIDAFDLWDETPQSNLCLGTFWSQCSPADSFASWYLSLETADADEGDSASATFRNAGNNPPNYAVLQPPVLGEQFTATVDTATSGLGVFLVGYRTPLDLATRFGRLLVNVADPSGEQFGSLAGPYPFVGPTADIAFSVPPDLTLCGLGIASQAVEFGAGVQLHNAQDLVLGF